MHTYTYAAHSTAYAYGVLLWGVCFHMAFMHAVNIGRIYGVYVRHKYPVYKRRMFTACNYAVYIHRAYMRHVYAVYTQCVRRICTLFICVRHKCAWYHNADINLRVSFTLYRVCRRPLPRSMIRGLGGRRL